MAVDVRIGAELFNNVNFNLEALTLRRSFEVFGRLQPGATLDDLRAQLATFSARLASRHPDVYPKAEGWEVEAVPLEEETSPLCRRIMRGRSVSTRMPQLLPAAAG